MDGGQVDSGVACFGVDAVAGVVLAGVFWRGLGKNLVDTFSVSKKRGRLQELKSVYESVLDTQRCVVT